MVLVVTARWRAKRGQSGKVAEILAQHAMQTRAEPGVVTFIAHQSQEDECEFFLYEQFVDREALAFHEETAHFKENVLERALPLLEVRKREYYDMLRI